MFRIFKQKSDLSKSSGSPAPSPAKQESAGSCCKNGKEAAKPTDEVAVQPRPAKKSGCCG